MKREELKELKDTHICYECGDVIKPTEEENYMTKKFVSQNVLIQNALISAHTVKFPKRREKS